jgi:putative MFS transporter
LALRGRNAEMGALLQKCFGLQAAAQITELRPSDQEEDDIPTESEAQPPISALFHPKIRRTTSMLWIIWFFFSFGAAAFYVLLPTLLDDGGFSVAVRNSSHDRH